MILSTKDSNQIRIRNSLIKPSLCGIVHILLGVKFYHKLVFDQNVRSCGKNAKAKLKALARVVQYIRK